MLIRFSVLKCRLTSIHSEKTKGIHSVQVDGFYR
jgi:hypothetical protein